MTSDQKKIIEGDPQRDQIQAIKLNRIPVASAVGCSSDSFAFTDPSDLAKYQNLTIQTEEWNGRLCQSLA
jgi:hypothetical protein